MIPTFHRSVINPHKQMIAQGHQATTTRRTRVQSEIAPLRRRSEMRGSSLRIHFRGIRLPQRRGWLVGCGRDVAPAVRMCAVELGGRAWDTPARVASFDPAEANALFHDLDIVQRAEVAVVHLRGDLIANLHLVVDVRLVG